MGVVQEIKDCKERRFAGSNGGVVSLHRHRKVGGRPGKGQSVCVVGSVYISQGRRQLLVLSRREENPKMNKIVKNRSASFAHRSERRSRKQRGGGPPLLSLLTHHGDRRVAHPGHRIIYFSL